MNVWELKGRYVQPPVCQPTFRYEESCVVEMRQSSVAHSFSFLVAFLTDDESCEGAIHRVIGHLARRRDGTDEEKKNKAVVTSVANTKLHISASVGLSFNSCT